MAVGKQRGEFSLKMDASIYDSGPGSTYTVQVSFRGPVTGEMAGTHRGTLTVVG